MQIGLEKSWPEKKKNKKRFFMLEQKPNIYFLSQVVKEKPLFFLFCFVIFFSTVI